MGLRGSKLSRSRSASVMRSLSGSASPSESRFERTDRSVNRSVDGSVRRNRKEADDGMNQVNSRGGTGGRGMRTIGGVEGSTTVVEGVADEEEGVNVSGSGEGMLNSNSRFTSTETAKDHSLYAWSQFRPSHKTGVRVLLRHPQAFGTGDVHSGLGYLMEEVSTPLLPSFFIENEKDETKTESVDSRFENQAGSLNKTEIDSFSPSPSSPVFTDLADVIRTREKDIRSPTAEGDVSKYREEYDGLLRVLNAREKVILLEEMQKRLYERAGVLQMHLYRLETIRQRLLAVEGLGERQQGDQNRGYTGGAGDSGEGGTLGRRGYGDVDGGTLNGIDDNDRDWSRKILSPSVSGVSGFSSTTASAVVGVGGGILVSAADSVWQELDNWVAAAGENVVE